MIKLTGKVLMCILMVLHMRGNGKMICRMVMGRRYGWEGRCMKVIMRKGKRMDKESLYGRMEPAILDYLWIII
jgi:hypothetical protein